MTRTTRLLVITRQFPWGSDDDPLELELPELAAAFERTDIVALGGEGERRSIPATASAVQAPLLSRRERLLRTLRAAADPQALRWGTALRAPRRAARAIRLQQWLRRTLPPGDDDILYGTGAAGAILAGMLRERGFGKAAIARLSSAEGVTPLVRRAAERLDRVFVATEEERTHFAAELTSSARIELAPLGAAAAPQRARRSEDGVLRIVSAGPVEPEQRLRLMMSALRKCSQPIEWTHHGSGSRRAELEQSCSSLAAPVRVKFAGEARRAAVRQQLLSEPVDLFATFADMAPWGVEDALAFGVPIFGTRSPRTEQLAGDEAGWLLGRDVPTAEIADALQAIIRLPASEREARALAAGRRWERLADARALARDFTGKVRGFTT